MAKNLRFISVITVIAAFFLIFLGMRIPFLEKNAKPKSRPRAVIKLSSKSFYKQIASDNADNFPSADIAAIFPVHSGIKAGSLIAACFILFWSISPESYLISLSQGRSPPVF